MSYEEHDFLARDELLYHCAELFYGEGLTKKEIADQIHVSPTHVKRLLEEATRKGIVTVEVKLTGRFRKLENMLTDKYHLRFARVVETSSDYEEVMRNLGQAAADFLEDFVQRRSRTRVGIGGGASLLRMIESLEKKPRPVDIYPTSLFGRGSLVEFVSSTFLAYYLLTKSIPIATAKIVGIPPLPRESDKARVFSEWLLREIDEVREVYDESKLVDLAFVGIGTIIPSRDIFSELSKLGYDFEYMKRMGAVGGINYNYFDSNGNQIGNGILTLSIRDLREISHDNPRLVVIVGGGSHKAEAIYVGIRTEIANSLITDEETARYLLRKMIR